MSDKKTLRITVVGAKFTGKKPFAKIFVKVTCGSRSVSTKVIAQKQKTLTPQWNEELEIQIDPADRLVIDLTHKKNTITAALDQGANQLKLEKGVAKEQTFDLKEATLDLVFLAVDFGQSLSSSKPMPPKASKPLPSTGPPAPTLEGDWEKHLPEAAKHMGLKPEALASMSKDAKMQFVQNYLASAQEVGEEEKPAFWVEKLAKPDEKALKKIQFYVNKNGMIFLEDFWKLDGLAVMTKLLMGYITKDASSRTEEDKKLKRAIAQTFYKMAVGQGKEGERTEKSEKSEKKQKLNTKGAEFVVKTPNAVNTMALLWNDADFDDKQKCEVLKFMSTLCGLPGGHAHIISAMTNYKIHFREKTRFETLCRELNTCTNATILLGLISFINALVGSPKDLDTRNRIRKELVNSGLNNGLERLRKFEAEDTKVAEGIDQEIESCDHRTQRDEKQMKTRYEHIGDTQNIVFSDIDFVYGKLKENIANMQKNDSVSGTYFQEFLVDLLGINIENEDGMALWPVVARILRQISMLKDIKKDEGLEVFRRFPLEQFLATIQVKEKEDVMFIEQECAMLEAIAEGYQKQIKQAELELEKAGVGLKARRDEYGELLNKKDEAFAESRQVTAELETQSTTLVELKKKHEEDTTFLAEADSLMADKKKTREAREEYKRKLDEEVKNLAKEYEQAQRLGLGTGKSAVMDLKNSLALEIEKVKQQLANPTDGEDVGSLKEKLQALETQFAKQQSDSGQPPVAQPVSGGGDDDKPMQRGGGAARGGPARGGPRGGPARGGDAEAAAEETPSDAGDAGGEMPRGGRGGPARGGPARGGPRGGPAPRGGEEAVAEESGDAAQTGRGGPARGGPRGGPARGGPARGGERGARGGPGDRGGPTIPEGPAPKGKVKNFNWKKIPPAKAQNTIFSNLDFSDGLKGFNLNFDEVEAKFTAVVAAKPESTGPSKPQAVVKQAFLDAKMAQNLNIWIAKYRKISHKDMITAAQNADEEVFDAPAVAALLTFIPSESEVQQMGDFLAEGGKETDMGSAEQFTWELVKVKQLAQRLKCFHFLTEFEGKKIDLMPDIQCLGKASNFISNDKRIKKFIEILLHVGNFLNSGNNRLGAASGFKLETLKKMGDTKTTDGKQTIFDIMVGMIFDTDKAVIQYAKEDLELVNSGARLSLPTFEAELKTLTKRFDEISALVPKIEVADDGDKFQGVMSKFLEKAKEDVATMNKDFTQAMDAYNKVVTLWGEDPATKPPDEFFQIWQELIINVTAATNNIVIEREKAEKLAKREALKKPPMGKPLSSVIAGGGAGGEPAGEDGSRGRGRGRGRGT